ncbi:hypothetical protein C9374_008376 [Naegleria lovaniensis]|uniref:BTB domain-containing protein n=1 Tax=Naegleria lovaniensis TaxID=51637 RepID=A0AA88GL94_NAELO|nr:uncharacterized protein C9374_008376 [Naegleria lovaniensis]KAG2378233.1 hypothetical protein C9374_008376 [Naegleria lovaniensis]
MFSNHHTLPIPTTNSSLSSSPLSSFSSSPIQNFHPVMIHNMSTSPTSPPFRTHDMDGCFHSNMRMMHQQQHSQHVILLDVGGQVFKTTRETLCKYEGYFSAYFRFLDHQGSENRNVNSNGNNSQQQQQQQQQQHGMPLENSGMTNHNVSNLMMHFHSDQQWINFQQNYIFLDRNPEIFKILLSCLRVDRTQMEDCLPVDECTLKQLYNESLFFSINELSEVIERKLFRKKKFGSVGVGFDKSKYISFVTCEGLNSKTSNQLSAPNTISEVYKVLHDNGCTVEHTIYRKAVESNIDSRIFPTDSVQKKSQIVTIIVSYYD